MNLSSALCDDVRRDFPSAYLDSLTPHAVYSASRVGTPHAHVNWRSSAPPHLGPLRRTYPLHLRAVPPSAIPSWPSSSLQYSIVWFTPPLLHSALIASRDCIVLVPGVPCRGSSGAPQEPASQTRSPPRSSYPSAPTHCRAALPAAVHLVPSRTQRGHLISRTQDARRSEVLTTGRGAATSATATAATTTTTATATATVTIATIAACSGPAVARCAADVNVRGASRRGSAPQLAAG